MGETIVSYWKDPAGSDLYIGKDLPCPDGVMIDAFGAGRDPKPAERGLPDRKFREETP